MLKVSTLVLAAALLGGCATKENKRTKQASLYFGAGTQSLISQDYTQALTSLLKANDLEPDNSEILTNLGMAYYFKGEKDLAIRHLNRALEINPNNSDAKVNLASINFNDGRLSEAERLYKQVLKDLTYDKQARTFYNLGMIEIRKGDFASAETYFKKSVKEDENHCPAYFQLGIMQFKRRQFNTALRNFKDASMGTCYENPAPHYYQALTMTELGRVDDARMKFDEVDTRFKKTVYAVKARTKMLELREKGAAQPAAGAQAARKVLESPDF